MLGPYRPDGFDGVYGRASCTPEGAGRCFVRTELDMLVHEDYILRKREQPEFADTRDRQVDFVLD
jgi:carbamoyltransferase